MGAIKIAHDGTQHHRFTMDEFHTRYRDEFGVDFWVKRGEQPRRLLIGRIGTSGDDFVRILAQKPIVHSEVAFERET